MVNDRLRRLKTGALDESKKLFGIFIYFWVLLSLFSFHKALVLKEEYLLYDQGFALVNALVLAKVVLIGEFFRVGDRLKNRPLIYPIIFKSAVFALLLICFHILERTLTGVLHGKTVLQSVPSIGGGTLQGILMVGIIMFVALMPFFAFRELNQAIGTQQLHALLFGDPTKAGAAPPLARRGWRIAEAAALVLALGSGWLIWSLDRGTSANSVAQKLDDDSVIRTGTATGVVGAAATVPVSARVSGVIQALECGAGTRVKAGQLCAKIDPQPYQAIIDQNKSDLAQAETRFATDKADLARAKAAFERHQALAKRRAVSRKAIEKSRKAFEQAEVQAKLDEQTIAQLQEALKAAETSLYHTHIVAPVDGTVVSRNVEIGQTVAAGSDAQPLLLIATNPLSPN
jgi:biotin carboxyl carrier protein